MERTLECSPYTILEDSEIYVKISVFAKSNVDLIVTHKLTFPQPPLRSFPSIALRIPTAHNFTRH